MRRLKKKDEGHSMKHKKAIAKTVSCSSSCLDLEDEDFEDDDLLSFDIVENAPQSTEYGSALDEKAQQVEGSSSTANDGKPSSVQNKGYGIVGVGYGAVGKAESVYPAGMEVSASSSTTDFVVVQRRNGFSKKKKLLLLWLSLVENVLHWHVVDTQSFPLEIPTYPKLWDGAYTVSERYTMADAAEIVSYAQRRGMNVLAEIDVPGHARSWGVGYPTLWPSDNCQQPLDVSKEFTFEMIDGILSDFSKIFKFKFIHLGGDEVNTSCWITTPHVRKWLKRREMGESEAYQYFVLRAQKIALSHGYEIVNWEETFNNFGSKLSRKTVVHNWLGGGVVEKVVASGLRCIVSNQDKWYLDHLDSTWPEFYMNEPLSNITDPKQHKLVIGGEVCMWGEQIDGSDIQQTIWPRAAAAAERLWTPYEKLAKDPRQATGRLAHFRCLLNQRGIAASPLAGPGRADPLEPGSCYMQ